MPGGKVEDGEPVLAAACREVLEETGIQAVEGKILLYGRETVYSAWNKAVLHAYDMALVRIIADCTVFCASSEGELCWLDKDEFLRSELVVPTDIDLVRRGIIAGKALPVIYTVMLQDDGRYMLTGAEEERFRKD